MVLVTSVFSPNRSLSKQHALDFGIENRIRKLCLPGGPTLERSLFPEYTAPGRVARVAIGISMQRNPGSRHQSRETV